MERQSQFKKQKVERFPIEYTGGANFKNFQLANKSLDFRLVNCLQKLKKKFLDRSYGHI